MPGQKFKTDPVGGHRYPIYDSIMSACKVGCFDCGAMLEPDDVKPTDRPLGSGTHAATCSMCKMVKEFDVREEA